MRLADRLRRDEAGFTLVELSVSMILGGLILATMVTVFVAFSQNVGDATGKADHQGDARSLVSEIVVELRQAITPGPNRNAVESLDGDAIAFTTLKVGFAEPVRVVYSREDCSEGECELWVRRYAANEQDDLGWHFADEPFEESFLLSGVLSDQPVFAAARWIGDPPSRQSVSGCGGGVDCSFTLVTVTLRSRPARTSDGARSALEIREEVRLRNA